MSLKALSEYTLYAKYSHYLPDKQRRETWPEIVERVFGMHSRKYADILESNPEFKEEFEFAKRMVRKKRVLGSQRALQFGGQWIEKNEFKIYNCSATYIDRARSFQESMYVLLCGVGLGFSVRRAHIAKLPNIKPVNSSSWRKWKVEDSIEGWSDAIGVIINSYFSAENSEFPEMSGHKVNFDYSLVRPEGSLIAGQFKAPGPKGLEKSIEKIRNLIEKRLASPEFKTDDFAGKLRPIDCYDIIMHASDAVLSGGVRRSATICMFDNTDKEMANAKIGNWFADNPQRARSNNSAVLIKGETTKEDFHKLMESTKHFGEPGFIWVDKGDDNGNDIVYNPCQNASAPILTKNGLSTFGAIKEGDIIWSETGWVKVVKKWSTGIKRVYKYTTSAGVFYGTKNHNVISNGDKIKVSEAESIDALSGPFDSNVILDPQDVMDGLVLGDGSVHDSNHKKILLHIGMDDGDYHKSEVSSLIIKRYYPDEDTTPHVITTTIQRDELPKTFLRKVPDRFFYGDSYKVCSFLRGLYSANGSVTSGRVTFKTASTELREQVQIMLSSLGIRSYFTTNKEKIVNFKNGEFLCKESYDINITGDKEKFYKIIGFIQKYKNEKLELILQNRKKSKPHKTSYEVKSVEFISEEEVFDITVDNAPHTYWTGGLNVSNCTEIGMIPRTEDGQSGVQVCNLTEINGKFCTTEEEFYEACRASAILGTMQAGFTNFKYLTDATKTIVEREALLGCSITGFMDNPEILLNPKIQKNGAEEIKKKNIKISKMIGINISARTTAVKPAGSTSCILGTASGIHPHHARRYIRRVQANRNEFPAQHYKDVNPLAVEQSVWSANGSDQVVSFLCDVPRGAILKNAISAVDFLEQIRTTQKNWVEYGTNVSLGVKPYVRHNVSCTVVVKPEEWGDVEKFIFDHQKCFSGISLLPSSGDLDYPQAPFSTVLTPEEIVEQYGDASVFASGLTVDGLSAFDNNLWKACDVFLGIGDMVPDTMDEPKFPQRNGYTPKEHNEKIIKYYHYKTEYDNWFLKRDWLRRAKQFSERYFNGDDRRMTHCLKHVSLWKIWCDISREHKDIDWSSVVEHDQTYVDASTLGAQACAGGACQII